MIDASVARRYARALLDVAAQGGQHEKVGEELASVAAALSQPEAKAMLANPGYSDEQRWKVVGAVALKTKATGVLLNFLGLLVQRQRITGLDAIARAYAEMVDAKVGRVRAVVTSAYPLGEAELAKIRDALANATRKSVLLEQKTDPSIVGGLVTTVGGTVWDGSIKTQLERLRDELKQAPL